MQQKPCNYGITLKTFVTHWVGSVVMVLSVAVRDFVCFYFPPPSSFTSLPVCVCVRGRGDRFPLQQRYAVKFVTTFSSVFATVFFRRLYHSSCLFLSSTVFRFSRVYLLCSQCLRPTWKFSPWPPVHVAQPACPPQLLLTTVY